MRELYTARHLRGITLPMRPFQPHSWWKSMAILKSDLWQYTKPHFVILWQSFAGDDHFFQPQWEFPREWWFLQLPNKQCTAFCVDHIQLRVAAVCKLPHQSKWVIMPTNARPVIIENIVLYSGHGLSWGDMWSYWSVTRWHLESSVPCSWDQQSYPGATWASIEDNYTKRRPCPFPNFIVKNNQNDMRRKRTTECSIMYSSNMRQSSPSLWGLPME